MSARVQTSLRKLLRLAAPVSLTALLPSLSVHAPRRTDSRYFLQAELELPAEWTLMRQGQPGVPDLPEWLATAGASTSANGPARFVVGYDPLVHAQKAVETLSGALSAAGVAPVLRSLRPTDSNLVDRVWGGARPPMPAGPARAHPLRWAGESVPAKLVRMRALLGSADAMLVVALDEIGWLLNLRGSDLPTTPVAYAYCLLTPSSASLFVNPEQVAAPDVAAALREAGVTVRAYDDVFAALAELGAARASVLLDPARTNSKAALALTSAGGTAVSVPSPPMVAKALKNAAELSGMLEAHLRDSAALCGAFAWLEDAAEAGEALDEFSVGERFGNFRQAQEGWLCDSFPIIVGASRNGAIIHYRAEEGACAPIGANPRDAMVLIDSGGQYECGTTDVTRTIHLGRPTALQRQCFTRVLKVRRGAARRGVTRHARRAACALQRHPQGVVRRARACSATLRAAQRALQALTALPAPPALPPSLPASPLPPSRLSRATSRWTAPSSPRARPASSSTCSRGARSGRRATTTRTARATAWAPRSTCTRAHNRSRRALRIRSRCAPA